MGIDNGAGKYLTWRAHWPRMANVAGGETLPVQRKGNTLAGEPTAQSKGPMDTLGTERGS